MGIIKSESITDHIHFLVWKIEEEEENLLPHLVGTNCTFDHIKNDRVRLESISARVALYFLLKQFSIPFKGLQKAENGKPFLLDNDTSISISHSRGYAAAVIDTSQNKIGIDIECIQPKVLRLIPRFANTEELNYAQRDKENPTLATRIWTIKEAIYKAFGCLSIEFNSQIVTVFNDDEPLQAKIKEVDKDFEVYDLFVEQFDDMQLSIAMK